MMVTICLKVSKFKYIDIIRISCRYNVHFFFFHVDTLWPYKLIPWLPALRPAQKTSNFDSCGYLESEILSYMHCMPRSNVAKNYPSKLFHPRYSNWQKCPMSVTQATKTISYQWLYYVHFVHANIHAWEYKFKLGIQAISTFLLVELSSCTWAIYGSQSFEQMAQ